MRLKSLASSSSLSGLEGDANAPQAEDEPIQTKGSIGPGGEKRLFDAPIEDEGVMKIRSALDPEELSAMPDDNMPLRHFRAEKVSIYVVSIIAVFTFYRPSTTQLLG